VVIAEHYRRIRGTEHEAYDNIKKDEVELSRLVVDSYLSEPFQEKIAIQFGQRNNFENLPGLCLFMMALATSNASVFHDVEGAKRKLEALDLASYPGENVTDFTSEAQRLNKVMQDAYAIPVNTGFNLVAKLTGTSSEFFNRKMWALLIATLTVETEYELADPNLFVDNPEYANVGPLALIAALQATHGMLLSQHKWSALTLTLPKNNSSSNANGRPGTVAPHQALR
jgi:hypothetical protein